MAGGVRRREKVTVHDGEDLEQTTGREILISDCRIGEIRVGKGKAVCRAPCARRRAISPSQEEAWGDVKVPSAVQREMIRRTIREHLDKEKRLRPQGIKVLSLFFIDAVGSLPPVRR